MSTVIKDKVTSKLCKHPEHNPPTHICIPYGKVMVHTCPSCQMVMEIGSPDVCMGQEFVETKELKTVDWFGTLIQT